MINNFKQKFRENLENCLAKAVAKIYLSRNIKNMAAFVGYGTCNINPSQEELIQKCQGDIKNSYKNIFRNLNKFNFYSCLARMVGTSKSEISSLKQLSFGTIEDNGYARFPNILIKKSEDYFENAFEDMRKEKPYLFRTGFA